MPWANNGLLIGGNSHRVSLLTFDVVEMLGQQAYLYSFSYTRSSDNRTINYQCVFLRPLIP